MNADQRLLAVLQMSQDQMDAIDDVLSHRKRDQEALTVALQPNSGKTASDIEECKIQLDKTGRIIKQDIEQSERKRAQLIRKTISKIKKDMIECQRQAVIQWDSYHIDKERKSSHLTTQFQQEAFILGSESEDDMKIKTPEFSSHIPNYSPPTSPKSINGDVITEAFEEDEQNEITEDIKLEKPIVPVENPW